MKSNQDSIYADQSDLKAFLKKYPNTQNLELIIPDEHGYLRGKQIPRPSMAKVFNKGVRLPGSTFSLNIRGDVIEAGGLGLKTGERDYDCLPLKGTLVEVPWKEGTAQVLISMRADDGSIFFAEPRGLVERVYQRLQQRSIQISMALEMEFYLLHEDSIKHKEPRLLDAHQYKCEKDIDYQVYSLQELDNYSSFLNDVYYAAERQAIEVNSIIAESSPGQFEVNLKHRLSPLHACDDALMLKRIIKAIARKHNFFATFMAKPFTYFDGSGTHIHIGLNDDKGNNLFAAKGLKTPLLQNVVGGMLNTMNACFLMQCPHINSYKRFCNDCYVGFCEHWGVNNRTVPVRVVEEQSPNIHLEQRVAGADVNPYLLAAACLAAIDYGIETKQQPKAPPISGNGREGGMEPVFMHKAIEDFSKSEWVKNYFGEKWQQLWTTCRKAELSAYEEIISPTEYSWYLTKV